MPPELTSEEHVGEWKLGITADTPEEIFAAAARALGEQWGDVSQEAGPWEIVEMDARDMETLLVDWLNELLGRAEVDSRAYSDVRNLRVSGGHIEGEVRGFPVREASQSLVKAATYHGLKLEQNDGLWRAVVLFDI